MANERQHGERDGQANKSGDLDGSGCQIDAQRSAAELSARAAQRLSVLGEMTGGIAHDFRNILAVIDSGLRLAENNWGDPRAASLFIAGARDGVARGLTLTSQLLMFAKQPEFQTRSADANELLKSLELFLKYGAGSAVRVSLELSSKIPDCVIDPTQFNAAVLNLVINARDAMPNGGEIQISTAPWIVRDETSKLPPGHYVRIRIRDSGTGMPEEVLHDIFRPFFTTKGEHGTGLGLPQVGAFMQNNGGHILVSSAVGYGTTFDLFFPAAGPNSVDPGGSSGVERNLMRSEAELT
jgi:signal transduction histidine kinase